MLREFPCDASRPIASVRVTLPPLLTSAKGMGSRVCASLTLTVAGPPLAGSAKPRSVSRGKHLISSTIKLFLFCIAINC